MRVEDTGAVFLSASDQSGVNPPDAFDPSFGSPSPMFILCRDKNGEPTAIYGEDTWDFRPYSLTNRTGTKMKFPGNSRLSIELKHLMFVLIYFSNAGRYGKLSVSTLMLYWHALLMASAYCESLGENKLVGQISLKQLFTNETYLTGLSLSQPSGASIINKTFPALLNHLFSIGEIIVGYTPIKGRFLITNFKKAKQHPIIPAKIYISLINQFDEYIEAFLPFGKNLEDLIRCFEDPAYGYSHAVQIKDGISKAKLRPEFPQALSEYGLTKLLSGRICPVNKRSFFTAIRDIQYVISCIIHCYTGMRSAEVLNMPYDCLSTKIAVEATIDDQGVERDRGQMINLLSTTTKFEGYKKKVSWLAPEPVQRAVTLAQHLARGLASLHGVFYKNSPLFINSTCRKKADPRPTCLATTNTRYLFDATITNEDLTLLRASDPSRKFSQPRFEVGQDWQLTSHQFRRSLAFYATSSGLVSLPSIKKQFKHHSLEMARYYSNGFEHIKSIFGYYDPVKKEFTLPGSHSAFEYQLAVPMALADHVMRDVLGENEATFGSTGSQADKLRKRVNAGEISIERIRKETENRAKNGEISYRETLLGGCTYLGKCNSFMLGNFTECLGCTGAVIQLSKIKEAISSLEEELTLYEEGSGEHDLTQYEIGIFVKYRDAIIDKAKKKELLND